MFSTLFSLSLIASRLSFSSRGADEFLGSAFFAFHIAGLRNDLVFFLVSIFYRGASIRCGLPYYVICRVEVKKKMAHARRD